MRAACMCEQEPRAVHIVTHTSCKSRIDVNVRPPRAHLPTFCFPFQVQPDVVQKETPELTLT